LIRGHRVGAFELGVVVVDELFDLCGSRCWDAASDFGFVKALCVDAAFLCFDVEKGVVDLEFKNADASFSDFLIDGFELLACGGLEIAAGQCLVVDGDDWYG
jgi:hypothetical protein